VYNVVILLIVSLDIFGYSKYNLCESHKKGVVFLFKIAVTDDDVEIHKLLKQYFLKLSMDTDYAFEVHYFFSGEGLLRYCGDQSPHCFQALFLDVEMGGMSGLQTAQQIRSQPDRDVIIMFLTSYPEYMMDSFDVQAFHYLIKPLSYELFKTKTLKLCSYILSSVNRFFTIKMDKEQIILRNSDIIAIVKIKHCLVQNKLKIITAQHQYVITGTLLEYSKKLDDLFLLIHRSVIINLEHIRKFTTVSVVMSNQDEFQIGRSQSKSIKDAYAHYMTAH